MEKRKYKPRGGYKKSNRSIEKKRFRKALEYINTFLSEKYININKIANVPIPSSLVVIANPVKTAER